MLLLVLLIEIIILYRLSTLVHNYLFYSLKKVFRSKTISLWAYSIIFLPGTIIHELAHYLTASVLFVPAGEMRIMPEYEDGGIRLGEVKIAKTDPIRRFIIGAAPLAVGLAVFLLLLYMAHSNEYLTDWRFAVLFSYVVFVISNTMFLSKKDLEGSWLFYIILFAVLATGYLLNINIQTELIYTPQIERIIKYASLYMLVPIAIDLGIVLIRRNI